MNMKHIAATSVVHVRSIYFQKHKTFGNELAEELMAETIYQFQSDCLKKSVTNDSASTHI